MKYIYSVLLLAFTFFAKANHTPTLFNNLNGINACWSEQTDIYTLPIYGAAVKTYSDRQLIQLHLQLVEAILRNRNTDGLSDAQKIARNNNLDHLKQYWQINTYPINNKTVKRNPVFIDDYNTFCAVGYLIKTSGHEPLARKIAATNNLAYLRDMRITELNQWVNNCGLTLDELAWIQPSYVAQNSSRSLGKGVNGPVYALTGDAVDKKIYVAGNFTQADGSVNCNHIVEINYDEYDIFKNTFTAMGDGLNGTVYALYKDGNDIYAGGSFDHSGTLPVNNIAKWNGTNWQGMGQLNGTVYCITKYNNKIYAGGQFLFDNNGQTYQNIAYWEDSTWKPICYMMNGVVNALTVYKNKLIVGGAFTMVDTTPINHVFAYDGTSVTSLEYGVTATVRTLESTGERLYAGGDLKANATDTNYFGIKWYDDTWGWEGDYLNDIYHGTQGGGAITHVNTISNHYIGGKLVGGGMYKSYNTAYYTDIDVRNNYLKSFASINADGETFAILSLGKKVFYGGEFSTITSGIQGGSDWSHSANNLAIWDPELVGLDDISYKAFRLSPNPTAGTTLIGSTNSINTIQVYDINGKLIWANTPEKGITEFSLERAIFPSTGLYLVTLQTSNGEIQNQKLLVE